MKLQSKKHPSAAFTLIEIMVVVIILGILAATIIPQFMGTTQDAKISAAKSRSPNWNPPWNAFISRWTATRRRTKA